LALLCRTYDVDDDGDIVVHEKKSDDHRQADERQVTDERHRERKCAAKVCRYNWHSAGSLGWPFPVLKYKYIFQIKYTEAIL